jgi:methyl-accepting chemotaxis protein
VSRFSQFQLNIGKKIYASFLLIIVFLIFNIFFVYQTLNKSIDITEKISEEAIVLVSLRNLTNLMKDSRSMTINWVYLKNLELDKNNLIEIHEVKYPELINKIEEQMTVADSSISSYVLKESAEVLEAQQQIMNSLQSNDDYEDIIKILEAEDLITSSIIPLTDSFIARMEDYTNSISETSRISQEEMITSFGNLRNIILILGLIAIAIAIIMARFLSKGIADPVVELNEAIKKMSKGELPHLTPQISKDELGAMKASVNRLIDVQKEIISFAESIGKGDINIDYEPLSVQDRLGYSLLAMKENLRKVIEETSTAVKMAGEEGNLSSRIDTEGKEGAWKQLADSMNNLFASIAIPFDTLNTVANAMSKGDLSTRYTIESKGDIQNLANNLNNALENLNDLLLGITLNANEIGDSSTEMLSASEEMNNTTGEIASAIGEMSSGAQNQVSKVDESSNLIEGVLKSANNVGSQAEEINLAAKRGEESSSKGTSMVDKVVFSMKDIKAYAAETNDSIKILTERSNEITRVLSIITDIASQTNLLALNAAIEAAQAGDAGRGFAVVAEEIRKLAEDSRKSAREIETLVFDVQNDTKAASKAIEVMNISIVGGETASSDASNTFVEIASSSAQTLNLSEQILNATKAQTESIMNVVNITEGIVVIAEETSAGTEEVASSATELSAGMQNYSERSREIVKIANQLKERVSKFKLANNS